MEELETLRQYYQFTKREMPEDLMKSDGNMSHFNVLKRVNCSATLPFLRRDYYKICLLHDDAVLHTASGVVRIDKPCVFFSNPQIRYGWESLGQNQQGYICLYNEQYLSVELRRAQKKLYTLFAGSQYPFLFLEKEDYDIFMVYFQRMHEEYTGNFMYRGAVIQHLLLLIIYQGIKVCSTQMDVQESVEAKDRVSVHFMELLDGQFPVDSPRNTVQLKTPADFADLLHVHVNHLNHCLKRDFGKSTTQLIGERLLSESFDLLRNTDWSISEIGNSLGFDYPQHFTSFFKKLTHCTPKQYRMQEVSHI